MKHIILTGGTDTARSIAKAIPATPLSAETGGKNVIILTASGDRDHTIMNIVISVLVMRDRSVLLVRCCWLSVRYMKIRTSKRN